MKTKRKFMQLSAYFRLFLAVLCVGFAAGAGAAALTEVIHFAEFLAFDCAKRDFGVVVDQASAFRRFAAVLACGAIASVGWYFLHKFKPFLSAGEIIEGKQAPFWQNLAHAFLQVFVVGLGAPIGKEVAPRELGALLGARICAFFGLEKDEARILVACGAGAGLGAVYNVPFAGAIFALEILLKSFDKRAALAAFGVCAVADFTANFSVPREALYVVSDFKSTPANLALAVFVGVIVGMTAKFYQAGVARAEANRIKDGKILIFLPLAFAVTALAGAFLPEILGNGQAAAQTAFNEQISPLYALGLLAVKGACVLALLKCGAYGGTLTPSFSLGALLGLCLGLTAANFAQVNLSAAALCGAAAFLAINLDAPFTAFALAAGFCDINLSAATAVMLSIACAMGARNLLSK